MTQLRCSAMVLPTDGRAPIVVADRRSNNAWVPDPWQTGREWAEPMGEALLDLGMNRRGSALPASKAVYSPIAARSKEWPIIPRWNM